MANFDWDQFEDADSSKSFNWDQFEDVPKKEVAPSAISSGIRGAIQGATGGFLDELSGAAEAAGQVVGIKGLGGEFSDVGLTEPGFDEAKFIADYIKARNRKREAIEQDIKKNPVSAIGGSVAGSIVSPLNKIMPGNTAKQIVKQGAALGAITGLGESEAESLSGMAKDVAGSTILGGGLSAGLNKVAPHFDKGIKKASEKVSEKVGGVAESLAARALGAERGTIKKLGADKVKDIGRYALENKLLSPLASTDDLIARNKALQKQGGEMMGDAYRQIDEASASTFNPLEVASSIDEQIGGFYRSPINKGETAQLENTLESVLMRGADNIPLTEAQTLKEELGKVAKWKNNLAPTDKELMARDAYNIVSKAIDDAAEVGANKIGVEGLKEHLQAGKKLFGASKGAEQLLDNKFAREQGNKIFGLTDTIMGAGALGYGGVTGDWQTSAGLMLGKKGLEKYGAQTGALMFDKASKALLKSPQMQNVLKQNPAVFNKMVNDLLMKYEEPEKENPQGAMIHESDQIIEKAKGSKYEQALNSAKQSGGNSLAAAIYVLQNRDPEFRNLLNNDA